MFRYGWVIMVCLLFLFGSSAQCNTQKRRTVTFQEAEWPAPLREAIAEAERIAATGDYKNAARKLSLYLQKYPDASCAYLYYDLGYFLHSADENNAAVAPLQTAVKLRPGFSEAWQLLGAVCHKSNRFAEAAVALERAAILTDEADTRYQSAVCWLKADNPRKALPLLETLQQHPNPRREWLLALAEALKSLKKNAQTARAMERAARLDNDPSLLYQAAWLWLEADRPHNALPLLKILQQHNKPRLEWLLTLSHVQMTLKHPATAAAVMDAVIRRDARPEYLYNGGLLWLQAEQAEKALSHLLRLSHLPNPEADWLIALSQAWLRSDELSKAAEAMEQAARISGKPGHAYHAGGLRLQLEQADAALLWLQPLQQHPRPKAEWLIALARAWVLKNNYPAAANTMEQAANISNRQEHSFMAAQLWLQADRPRKALPLLQQLTTVPTSEAPWLVTLSATWQKLENLSAAAEAMERAAGISGEGTHYHRAALLWRQQKNIARSVRLLEICVRQKPVKQRWLVDLADELLEWQKPAEARAVMARTTLNNEEIAADVRFKAATLWLQLQRPQKALPILYELCRSSRPAYDWLATLVKTCVEVGKLPQAETALNMLVNLYPEKSATWQLAVWVALQQSNFAKAAAAMEVVHRLTPDDARQIRNLSQYYAMAGIPVRAAETLRKTLPKQPAATDWDRLTNIYLSGQRYKLALPPARAAVAAEQTADRWEMLGDIFYRLRRFEDSLDAYRHATELSEKGELSLKRGYAFLKLSDFKQASDCFRAAIAHAENNNSLARSAHQSLAYIQELSKCSPPDTD